MSTDVAIKHIAIQSIRNMKEDDAGGGNGGGRNELKLKRKSNESIPEIGGKKMKNQRKTIRRKKLPKWKKIPKKPRSLDGDNPASETKKVTTTTATSSGGTGKRRRRLTESFNAPFNSTQFLMNDHKTEAVRHLDSTLNGEGRRKSEINIDDDDSVDIIMAERPLRRITRARESSFSIDSDDDYYYSSPEDEEEFMSREFIKDYDSLRNDRLIDMSKAELINEYLQMEEKIEALEKRLSRQSSSTDDVPATDQNENKNDDTNSKEAMADTILQFQKEIQRLESENDQLKLISTQSAALPAPTGCSSSCSSSSESDSESETDSDSDDSDSDSDSDNGEEEIQISAKQVISGEKKLSNKAAEKGLEIDCEVEGDTGYESGHSNKPVHSVTNNTTGTTSDEGGINPNEEKEVVINGNLTENWQKDENDDSDDLTSEMESCPELISVNCITSTSP